MTVETARDKGSNAVTVTAEGIRVAYAKRTVVQVEHLTLEAGRTYALLGASGAGKSTLLRTLGLLERPTAGVVTHDGREVRGGGLAVRRQVAAVLQKPYLLRGTVAHNVAYGLRLRGVARKERIAKVREALALVGLSGWEKRSALTLSGGEAQRVALARALVLQPTLLLLDEPLSYLDPLLKRDLAREFARILSSEHITAFYVTHDIDEAAVVADRIGVMRDGRIIAEGDPATVLALPADEWVASFLGTEMPAEGTIVARDGALARIAFGGVQVAAACELPEGTPVLLGVRPEDALLFPANDVPSMPGFERLDGAVAVLEEAGVTRRVIVAAAGARFSATVSRATSDSLGLAVGAGVALLFKPVAVRVAPRSSR